MSSDTDTSIGLIQEIEALLPRLTRTLEDFYSDELGFRATSGSAEPSPISHAVCVEASFQLPWDPDVGYQTAEQRRRQLEVLLDPADWRTGGADPGGAEEWYATSVVIPALTRLDRALQGLGVAEYPELRRRICEALRAKHELLQAAVDRLVDQRTPLSPWQHAMFLHRLLRARRDVEDHWLQEMALAIYGSGAKIAKKSSEYKDAFGKTTRRLEAFMGERLYQCLAMCSAIEGDDADAIELAFLLHALHERGGFTNEVTIEHGVSLALARLLPEGGTPRFQTILRQDDLKQPKRILNISASPLEALSLLSELPLVRRSFPRYEGYYHAVYSWLRKTQRDVSRDYRGQPSQCPVWRAEPWRGEEEAEAWVNAQVLGFLCSYRDLLEESCADRLLLEFGASTAPPKHLWSDLALADDIRAQLTAGFMEPIKKAIADDAVLPVSSMILYGPPGTAKTSIARALAWELGLPFIELHPHHFAEEGLGRVIHRAREIFRRLQVMRNCVVLFDEVDELVATREGDDDRLGRFITTSVLPWFAALHDRERIVFVVATNHIDRFDYAIKRPGRFDMVLPIGPLDADRRAPLAVRSLLELGVERACAEKIAKALSDALGQAKYPDTDELWQVTIGEIKLMCGMLAQSLADAEDS